jgi:hypothetical protein
MYVHVELDMPLPTIQFLETRVTWASCLEYPTLWACEQHFFCVLSTFFILFDNVIGHEEHVHRLKTSGGCQVVFTCT